MQKHHSILVYFRSKRPSHHPTQFFIFEHNFSSFFLREKQDLHNAACFSKAKDILHNEESDKKSITHCFTRHKQKPRTPNHIIPLTQAIKKFE
jgi:hypothetical protein